LPRRLLSVDAVDTNWSVVNDPRSRQVIHIIVHLRLAFDLDLVLRKLALGARSNSGRIWRSVGKWRNKLFIVTIAIWLVTVYPTGPFARCFLPVTTKLM